MREKEPIFEWSGLILAFISLYRLRQDSVRRTVRSLVSRQVVLPREQSAANVTRKLWILVYPQYVVPNVFHVLATHGALKAQSTIYCSVLLVRVLGHRVFVRIDTTHTNARTKNRPHTCARANSSISQVCCIGVV